MISGEIFVNTFDGGDKDDDVDDADITPFIINFFIVLTHPNL